MPSEKRERQRAGREAKRAAAAAAQKRAQRKRQIIAVATLVAVIVGIGVLINVTGGDDETEVTAGDTTSTTSPSGDDDDSSSTSAPAAVDVAADCPEVEGDRRTTFDAAPELALEDGVDYQAEVCTDLGTFTIDLAEDDAPTTVNSFVFLARNRAYENIPFHRVIPGFVVQGGDVGNQDGSGGPGYKFADELPEQGEYEIGSVAMANSGKDTNGSQFFVITGPDGVSLPPNYSLFGKVIDGLDVVQKIEADGSPSGEPTTIHKIGTITILEKEG